MHRPRGGTVDTADLKSASGKPESRFESGRGHQSITKSKHYGARGIRGLTSGRRLGSIYVRTVSVRIVPKLIGRASGHANGAAGLFPPPALGERCHRSLAASVKKCITRPAATTGTQLVGSRVSVPVALRNHRLSISEYPVNAAPTKVIDGRAAQTFRTSAMIPSPLVCCPVVISPR